MLHRNEPPTAGSASLRARKTRRPLILILAGSLLALFVFTSALAGYLIGRGEAPRLNARFPELTADRVYVASLQPTQAPTTVFDCVSLMGSVQGTDGKPDEGAKVTLLLDGAILSTADRGAFSFRELEQGLYTLRVTGVNGETAEASLQVSKTERLDAAFLTPDGAGGYLLSAAPSVSTAVLILTPQGKRLGLTLSSGEAIGLLAYQLWETETPVHIFTERTGNQVTGMVEGRVGDPFIGSDRDQVALVAPGSNGSFIFVIENPAPYPLECSVSLSESNSGDLSLPMRFRLREDVLPRDEEQEKEPWVKAEDILLPSVWVQARQAIYYTLEWKWDPSDNSLDTAFGTRAERPYYRLRVNVTQALSLPETEGK